MCHPCEPSNEIIEKKGKDNFERKIWKQVEMLKEYEWKWENDESIKQKKTNPVNLQDRLPCIKTLL